MTAADRLITLIGALAAVVLIAVVLRPVTDSSAAPQLELSAATGAARIANSKLGAAILGVDDWRPGQRVTGKVAIANTGRGDAVVRLSATQLQELPGPGGGRLSRATRIRVVRKRPVIDGQEVVFDGRLTDLSRIRVGDWPAGGSRYFRLQATMAPATDRAANSYQAAELSFSFVWSATAAG